jgi:pilus assembly protein CpaD
MHKGMTPMTKRPFLLAALAATTLLAGCGTPNRGLESVHQPVVSRTDYVIDVQTADAGLADGEAKRLRGWMDAMRLGYGDAIAIDDPRSDGAARADVAAVAAGYGLLLSDGAPVTAAQVAPGTIRVIVSRTKATVPGCPDYTRMSGTNFDSHTGSNQGCAINGNLAAMIANPGDLVRGAPGATGQYDAESATRAITTLRDAKPTGEGGGWLKGKSESTGGK